MVRRVVDYVQCGHGEVQSRFCDLTEKISWRRLGRNNMCSSDVGTSRRIEATRVSQPRKSRSMHPIKRVDYCDKEQRNRPK